MERNHAVHTRSVDGMGLLDRMSERGCLAGSNQSPDRTPGHQGHRLSLLAVVLLASNMTRRAILSVVDPGSLFLRHHTVRFRLVF